MKADLIIHNIKTLYNPNQEPPVKGLSMSQIEQIDHAFIAIKKEVILHVGRDCFDHYVDANTQLFDAKQKIAVPGFIDPHTHLVHAGSREYEYEKLQKGTPYLDILKQGGGILGTVNKTQEATETSLYQQALVSLNRMLAQGVTAIEAKSGYGLDLDTEIKQLVVAKKLNEDHPIEIVSTYLNTHTIPKKYQENPQDFVLKIINDLKEIKNRNLAEAVDVFCETGVFSIEDTKKILTEAKKLGFLVKLHADEIHPLGGAGLGVELQAVSADHLMAIKDTDIPLLAQSNTIATLLPGTSFFLKKGYAPARKMIDQGCAISISTDYNPGSSPSEAFQLMMQIAFTQLNMTPKKILNTSTINPAYQLKRHQEMGSIKVGKKANIVLLDVPNLTYMLYHYGICHTQDVQYLHIQVS